MSVLYDIALVIGGEVSVRPLLIKTLQRILYHTSFPTGLIFLDLPADSGVVIEARVDASVGDFGFAKLLGTTMKVPSALLYGPAEICDAPELLAAIPGASRSYGVCLRLPIGSDGVMLLLAPRQPTTGLPLTHVFQPVMANLAKAILLCRHNDALAAGLVAERDLAQQSLAESEERFHSITAVAQDAIVTIDEEGRLAYWNPAAERMFGYRTDEVIGREAHRLIAPERYYAAFVQGFKQFRTTGAGPVVGTILELQARHKDGSEFPVEVSVSALRLRERWHAVGILRDITARKQSEAALRCSEESLKEAQRIAHVGSWEHDLINNNLTWSDEVHRIFEIEPSAFAASYEAFLEAVHPDDRAMVDRAYSESMNNRTAYEITHRLLMSDGRVKYVNERGETSYAEDGTPLRSVGTVQDITEQRVTELRLERANRALKTLSGCNGILVRATDEKLLLDDICRLIVDTGGYLGACVGYGGDGVHLHPVAHAGFRPDDMDALERDLAAQLGVGPATQALLTGKAQTIQDIGIATGGLAVRRAGIVSMIVLPLLDDGLPFGVLKVYAGGRESFDGKEVDLLRELAEDLAFGLITLRVRRERERLQAAEYENVARLRRALLGTIQAVALTVEKRDPYTAGHQQRVARLAVAIAKELGWPDEKVEGMRLGAMIHDIGKVYVPAEILTRPGRITELEFSLIKGHPQVGFEIVQEVEFPWPVAQIIVQHHERLDGSGYPNGLPAEKIIPEARVLAVADVVEAMAAHRPYRAALGVEAGLGEIESHRGTRFDADVVDACIRVFRARGFTFD